LGFDAVRSDWWLQLFCNGLLLLIDGSSIGNHVPEEEHKRCRKQQYPTDDHVPAPKTYPFLPTKFLLTLLENCVAEASFRRCGLQLQMSEPIYEAVVKETPHHNVRLWSPYETRKTFDCRLNVVTY
jgi:hypothetical protein